MTKESGSSFNAADHQVAPVNESVSGEGQIPAAPLRSSKTLVEQLRSEDTVCEEGENCFCRKSCPLHGRAADEIERLTRELAETKMLLDTYRDQPIPDSETEGRIDEQTARHWLGELLAVIHRDGGHYEAKYGTIVATQDAEKIVHALRGENKCKVCDGLGYSVGVNKRHPCDECEGTGLLLLADHAKPIPSSETEGKYCPRCGNEGPPCACPVCPKCGNTACDCEHEPTATDFL